LGIPAATSTAGQGTMPEPKKHLQIRHRIYETEYLVRLPLTPGSLQTEVRARPDTSPQPQHQRLDEGGAPVAP
ncbi:MAG: hypothetical protein ACLQU2_22055, partial [Candidatus Binataceae bacterium]